MKQYTDTQLKKTLAKMLPDLVFVDDFDMFRYLNEYQIVLDTELLHLCWLVEKTISLTEECEFETYTDILSTLVGTSLDESFDVSAFKIHTATWQQRVVALAQVKGVEIV